MSIEGNSNDNADVYNPVEEMTREEKIEFLNARDSILWADMLTELRFWGCAPVQHGDIVHEWTDGFFTTVRYNPFEMEWSVHTTPEQGGELIGTVEDTGIENDEAHVEKVNELILEGKP